MKFSYKHINLFLFLVFSVLLIGGCQSKPHEESFFVDDFPMDRRIGVIKSLGGVKTENSGTHILQLDNGDTVLLKSLAINLDDEKYFNQMVEVRGVLTYTKDNKSLMEIMNIDILEQYEIKEVKKSKWISYDNEYYDFSIKYRDDFKLIENSRGVTFEIIENKTSDTLKNIEEDDENTDSEEGYEGTRNLVIVEAEVKSEENNLNKKLGLDGDSSEDLLKAELSMSKIGIDGIMAYKKEVMDGAGVYFYTQSDKYIYTISFEAGEDANYIDAKNIFYEMLSSLKIESPLALNSESNNNSEDNNDSDSLEDKSEDKTDEKQTDNISNDESNNKISFDDDFDSSIKEESVEDKEKIEVKEGFNVFENETFDFTVQYPKNWYYSGKNASESGVVRRYEFGDKPMDEESGSVFLDIYKGSVPSDYVVVDGIKSVNSNGSVEYYVEENGKLFRISGPSYLGDTILFMAKSLI